ncbi:MAG TPA: hypothetical protein VF292_08605 [Rhodanobacteraceae bacterium]
MSHVFSLKSDALDGIVLVEAANRARAVRYLAAHTTADLIEGGELAKAVQGGAKFFDATQEADAAESAADGGNAAGGEAPSTGADRNAAPPTDATPPRESAGFALGVPSGPLAFGA